MKPRQPILITALIVIGLITFAFAMFTQSSAFFSSILYWASVGVGILMLFINQSLNRLIDIKKYNSLTETQKQNYLAECKLPFFKRLRQSAVEKHDDRKESEMLIDHGFDGIMELDNALPAWWLNLFYFGVAFCICYLILFFSSDTFARPDNEYIVAVEEASIIQARYDETKIHKTIETVELKPELVADGEKLFKENNCVSCHKEGGAGISGPNLTDDKWINIKQKSLIKNVFHMVWNGSENNPAMRAFGKGGEIKGDDIEKLANYIYHINQMIPDIKEGKKPEGTLAVWEDAKK